MRILKKYTWLLSLIILLYLLNINNLDLVQYYDAKLYCDLSSTFGEFFSKQISYPNTYRGYLFPLFIGEFTKIFTLNFSIILLNSILVIVLSYYIYPIIKSLLSLDSNTKFTFLEPLVFFIVIIYFWVGYFKYALSDFPAFVCLLLAIIMFLKNKLLYYLFSGVFLAASLNIRPIYQINLLIFVVFLIYYIIIKRIELKILLILILGMSLILTPQLIINRYYNNSTLSPFVQTSSYAGKNLYLGQLFWGMKIQKYETYIGSPLKYPYPAVNFKDSIGLKLYESELSNKHESVSTYVLFIVKHPLYYLGMLLKHLFNGFDIKYSTPYIKNLDTDNIFSFLNYLIFALAIYSIVFLKKSRLIEKGSNKLPYHKIFIYSNLLLPILFVIPTAIEVRFMIPLYFLSYIYAINFIFGNNGLVKSRMKLALYIFLIATFVIYCFFISNTTYSSLSYS